MSMRTLDRLDYFDHVSNYKHRQNLSCGFPLALK